MKKNYLLLVHQNPRQVYRLIRALQDGDSRFFVHVDLKSNLQDFEILRDCQNTFIIPERVRCLWGDYSIVQATIHLLKNAATNGYEGFTILLSGQDYPIKSNLEINRFLLENQDYSFMDIVPIEQKWSKKMVGNKIHHYHILHSEKKSDSNSYAPFLSGSIKEKARTILHVIKGRLSTESFKKLLELPVRKPYFSQQYAGSQWWALNETATQLIIRYIQENEKELENYYQFTAAPDEIFFHSILKNLQRQNTRILIKPSLTYTNWSRKNTLLPVTFAAADLEELLQPEFLWARKFDINYNVEILNIIDEKLRSEQP